jgi:hypothetical protein
MYVTYKPRCLISFLYRNWVENIWIVLNMNTSPQLSELAVVSILTNSPVEYWTFLATIKTC